MNLEFLTNIVSLIGIVLGTLIARSYLKEKEDLKKSKFQYMEKEDYLFKLLNKYCKDTSIGCDIIDEFRLKFNTDEYIQYDNYKLFAIENNVILPHEYDNILIEYFNKHPKLKNLYTEYYERLV